MTSLGVVALAAVLAAGPQAGVALTKRSGVNRALALSRSEQVRTALGAALTAEQVEDLTACASKLPCLVKEARSRGWSALVAVETANILKEAIVDVRLISIDDDGRELARGNAQQLEQQLAATLPARLAAVRDELQRLAAPPRPVAEKPVETTPVKEVVPPPPPPPVVVAVAPPPEARPAGRWIPLGVSLGVLAAGGVCLGIARAQATQLATATLDDGQIDALVSSGKTLQALGVGGLIGGGVLSAASLVLALAWPASTVAPSAVLEPGGAMFGLTGVFP